MEHEMVRDDAARYENVGRPMAKQTAIQAGRPAYARPLVEIQLEIFTTAATVKKAHSSIRGAFLRDLSGLRHEGAVLQRSICRNPTQCFHVG